MSQKELSGRLARWSLKLQAYNFEIEHQRASQNVVPDALSRAYNETTTDRNLQDMPVGNLEAVDLQSPCFEEPEYVKLKKNIESTPDQYPNLKIQDDRIYIRMSPHGNDIPNDIPLWKLWIPDGLIPEILASEHDDPTAVHGGIKKTLERIRRYYYWPRMRQGIVKYVGDCGICKSAKAPNKTLRPPMGQHMAVDRPFQKLYIDLLGPYPRSKKGNTVILVVLDKFTKFVLLKAMAKATANKICEYLLQEVLCVYGVPEYIHTDNGAQFISKEFNQLLKLYGVKHTYTAAYSPQANASERVNRSILAAIRSYLKEEHTRWDEHLHEVACALRNSVHESVGASPYFLLFGQHYVQHGNSYKLLKKLDSLQEHEVEVLPSEVQPALVYDKVRKHLETAYQRNASRYNLRARPVNFSVGQEVYVRNFALSDATKQFSAKLAPKFNKCRIRRKVGNVNYELVNLDGKVLGIYHAKDIHA